MSKKFKLNKKQKFIIKKYVLTYFLIILSTAIMAIGTAQFLLPNQLSSGGFSGLATIGYYLFEIPIGLIVLALNIPLFLIAYFRIGGSFLIKTAVGTISLSIFLNIFESLPPLTEDRFLACVYGGVFVGLGTALTLRARSSTGGSDLLAYIIRSFNPNVSTGQMIVVIDVIIVGLNVLFFREIEIGLYSAVAIFILGKIIDIVFEGVDFSKVVYIISKKHEKIAHAINTQIKRGVTGIYARGIHKSDDTMMLMSVVSRQEVVKVRQIVKKIDPTCFVVVSNVREVIGNGFKR